MKKIILSILLILLLNPLFSQTFLTRGQVYDFNVGDVVQGRYLAYSPFGGGPPTYETRTILGKEIVASLDTILYTVKRDFYTLPSCPTCSPTFSYDTITQTITNLTLPASHNNQTTCFSLRDTLYFDTCGRQVWEKIPVFVDNCFEPITHTTRVVEGVGGVFFTKSDPSTGGGPTNTQFILTYYSKNSGSCGNFTNELIENQVLSSNIQIYPNPSKETITIKITNGNNIQKPSFLLDASGREIKTIKLTGTETQVGISDLNPGIYFVKVGDWVEKVVVE